jgi:hypothetical protein
MGEVTLERQNLFNVSGNYCWVRKNVWLPSLYVDDEEFNTLKKQCSFFTLGQRGQMFINQPREKEFVFMGASSGTQPFCYFYRILFDVFYLCLPLTKF